MKIFRPMLAPNDEINTKDLKYPLLASYKIDGIRCIFKEGQMLSRSLKTFPNKQLRERFENINRYALASNYLLDGELYSKSMEFNDLSGLCRQLDKELPEDLMFNCFDVVEDNNFTQNFQNRVRRVEELASLPYLNKVSQWSVFSAKEVADLYKNALSNGFEGLILRDPKGKYKFGRGTIKEGLIYKLKPFLTFDAIIIDVLESTVVDPKAEKTINELGYSRTSKLKKDRLLSGRASDFVVKYKDKEVKVAIAGTNVEKEEYLKNKELLIGMWIEYKGMLVGAKDVPRHPVFLRFRADKS